MPKRLRKNGIVRMKNVSEICEIDESRIGVLHAEASRETTC